MAAMNPLTALKIPFIEALNLLTAAMNSFSGGNESVLIYQRIFFLCGKDSSLTVTTNLSCFGNDRFTVATNPWH
jgi:hypothetical protein